MVWALGAHRALLGRAERTSVSGARVEELVVACTKDSLCTGAETACRRRIAGSHGAATTPAAGRGRPQAWESGLR